MYQPKRERKSMASFYRREKKPIEPIHVREKKPIAPLHLREKNILLYTNPEAGRGVEQRYCTHDLRYIER